MAHTAPAQLLLILRRIVLAALKFKPSGALFRAILRKLAWIWCILRSKTLRALQWASRGQPAQLDGMPPRPENSPWDKRPAPPTAPEARTPDNTPQPSLDIISNGEVIALDGSIAASLYPYGKGMHSNVSRSSLAAVHNSHLQGIARRSNASFNVGPRSSNASTNTDVPDIVIRSPTLRSPIPHRQFSMSSPTLGSPTTTYPPRNPLFTGQPIRSTSPEPVFSSPSGVNIHSPVSPVDHQFPNLDTVLRTSPDRDSVLPPASISSRTSFNLGIDSRSTSPVASALASETIFPMVPEYSLRYFTRGTASRESAPLVIPTLTTSYMKDASVPKGWSFLIHPEGQPYFYNKDKRTYTDADLFNPKLLERIEDNIHEIETKLTRWGLWNAMPKSYDLALELWMDDDNCMTNYYFADHDSRTIFFVDPFEVTNFGVVHEVSGVQNLRHIQFELTAQYWYHVQAYPTCISLTEDDLCKLRDEVMHNIGDLMTSPYSTSPYALDELHKILSLLTPIGKNIGRCSPGSLTLVARFNGVFARSKFYNWHGLPCARLERHVSVYGDVSKVTWLLKGLSPFLFSAPDVVHRLLQKIWTDGLLHKCVYEDTIKKLNDEWQELILFATVLLNANVAFLSIESVDEGQGNSLTQITSYISTLMSAGAIILGLLLVRQTRTKNRDTAADMQAFLRRRTHATLGLETLAILFSLPYALLMWSVVFFLAAFSFTVLIDGGTATRSTFCLCGFAVALFTVWCIATGWEKAPAPDDQYPLPSIGVTNPEGGSIYDHDTQDGHQFGSKTRVPSPMVVTPLERVLGAVGLQRNDTGRWSVPPPKQWGWNMFKRRRASTGRTLVASPRESNDV